METPAKQVDINIKDNSILLKILCFAIDLQNQICYYSIYMFVSHGGKEKKPIRHCVFRHTNNYMLHDLSKRLCAVARKFIFMRWNLNWPECELFRLTRTVGIQSASSSLQSFKKS